MRPRPSSPHLDVLPALRELEHERLAILAKTRRVTIGVLVAVFVMVLANWGNYANPILLLAFIFATAHATTLFLRQIQLRMMKGVIVAYKERVIPQLVSSLGGTLTYHKDQTLPRESLACSMLFFDWPEDYRGEDLITGTIGETRLSIAEVRASRNTSEDRSHVIFDGVFFELDFNKPLQGSVFLYPDSHEARWGKVLGQSFQENFKLRGELIKLEDPDFERYFVAYGSDPIEARYVLTPAMMRRLVAFREKAGVPVAMSFIGGKLYIAVYHEGDYLEPDIFKSLVDRAEVTRVLDELRLALGIVEYLNLNHHIWETTRRPT